MQPDDETISGTADQAVPRRRRPAAAAVAVAVVLLAGIGVLTWPAVFRPAAATGGEVFLEPATAAGRDPFTGTVVVGNPPGAKSQSPPGATAGSVPTVTGDTPALYGGSRNAQVCDRAQLVEFLGANPDKAAAWAGVLGIAPADIATYVATLTPVQLRVDTRVTNHGYADGRATSLQSVLQAGTAVLVDDLGRPRVRCACGNPLLEPVATPVRPLYTGEPWPGFDAGGLAAVTPAAAPISTFVVHDLVTGEAFFRPRGTAGEADTPVVDETGTPLGSAATPAAPGPGATPAPGPGATPTRDPGTAAVPCPAGTHRSGGTCVADAPDACPIGQVRVSGRCAPVPLSCPAGAHPDAAGTACVPDAPTPCPAGTRRAPDGTCVTPPPATCPQGTHREGDRCVTDTPPPVTCPQGTHREGGRCAKDTPTRLTCARGTHPSPDGTTCVTDTTRTVTCREGTHPTADGTACVTDTPACRTGYHLDALGRCVPDQPPCPPGTTRARDGTCVRARAGRRRQLPCSSASSPRRYSS